MRIRLTFEFEGKMLLPLNYNHIIQASILNWIDDEEYQKYIHDIGYTLEKRNYKLYVFSRMEGKFNIIKETKQIEFDSGCALDISAIDEKLLMLIIQGTFKNNLRIGRNNVTVKSITKREFEPERIMRVRTKSPITVYSTVKENDQTKTLYYTPYQEEFYEKIRLNIMHKYESYFGNKYDGDFEIKLLNEKSVKEKVIKYKNFVIKGYEGEFLIQGSSKIKELIYNTGLGSKNSQGFGMIDYF